MSFKKKIAFAFLIILVLSSIINAEGFISYLVKKGDSLSLIAQRFNVSLQELIDLNQIENPDLIYVNQELKIPGNEQTYRVKKGDSLWKIAEKFAVKIRSLIKLNNITTPDKIYIGQELLIPANEVKADYQLAFRGQAVNYIWPVQEK